MATTPALGDLAPDFTLPGTTPGQGDRDFTLSAEQGHPVVLAFYPGDETPVCTKQLCSYQSDLQVLEGLDATLWGISAQDVASHKRFQQNRGLTFPLLADVDNAVFKTYGLGSLLNRRAIFVIDADGRIAYAHVHRLGVTYQKTEQIAEVLRGLPKAAPVYPSEATPAKKTATRRPSKKNTLS
ncbi:MAG: thioredoxin-dependent peroxiredoxin [Frankiaceae bacterium]|nr:thioredoxin-dependent peroxiredoxin [Frankiaceae bacterium]